ncbi:MAG: response regulator transcription factor [Acidimicrobiia bacterium]|nr:response regulator transcription factor [Acidimicrobiia bacterium]
MIRVLVVEDEASFVEAIKVSFEREGFTVDSAANGRQGLERFREHPPDLVLLDLMLPEISGLDVLRAIRRESDVAVIVVSAKDAEADVVTALELGADDYVTKPYSIRELLARVRAATRRRGTAGTAVTVGAATLDRDAYLLRVGEAVIDLPRKEFEVLMLLMEHPGRVVTREDFLDKVWGYTFFGDTRTLDQHIRRLRRRLEEHPGAPVIETVRGVGYRVTA